MKLLLKLETVNFVVSVQTYKFSRGLNDYFPQCIYIRKRDKNVIIFTDCLRYVCPKTWMIMMIKYLICLRFKKYQHVLILLKHSFERCFSFLFSTFLRKYNNKKKADYHDKLKKSIQAKVTKLHFHINSRNQSKLVMLIENTDLADGPHWSRK